MSDMKTIIDKLTADGWREYPNQLREFTRSYYKRFDTPTRCNLNRDKEGMQIGCFISEIDGRVCYELVLCGELRDGTWIKLHRWAMPNDIEDGLRAIPSMLDAWEHIASRPMPADEGQSSAGPAA